MFADIWIGNTETSEVFLVVAVILFLVATVVHFSKNPKVNPLWFPLLTLGLACVTFALLVL